MRPNRFGPFVMAGVALGVVGVALRVNNAFRYPTNWGFDAKFNWEYIERLLNSWALPAPDATWATGHPPLFYYLGAALGRALGHPGMESTVLAIRLLSTGFGLASVALAVLLVRRVDPGNPRRALLAGGLLLFLPVHIYMSAMLSEEILASSLTSFAVIGAALAATRPGTVWGELARAFGIGLAAGLALLTKLSGALVVIAVAGAYAVDGWRRREPLRALGRIAATLGIAAFVGGWYYAYNRVEYGYFYPQDLSTHRVMFTMPPGERNIVDYLRVPLATWTDPQLLEPGLVRSVWGSTYVTVWFDGHRFFLPKESAAVRRIGTAILLLALLPTTAFVIGLGRGLRRALRSVGTPDTPLLLLTGLTLGGYILFTWRNPWFASVKGSYLLGISVPFSFYASEVLADWMGGHGVRTRLAWATMGLLALASAVTFTYGPIFAKWEFPGLEWR
ncbi:MAG: phospholipid carrier-dependent glycosyltransferase [Deltaproteobacteria bacterium]|nr:MAG: phospholipid carrier-dependent glycosyltransferase [Deltaproteobacteria bacterium]